MRTAFKLRPSSAARWLKCPASVLLEKAPGASEKPMAFPHAAMGTAAHEILEQCIRRNTHPVDFIGEQITVPAEHGQDFDTIFVVDYEMAANVSEFLSHVEFFETDNNVFPELTLTHSKVPELGGTSDYVEVDGSFAKIYDYKNGTGPVIARHQNGVVNPQLMCYASLVFDFFPELELAEVGVVQPRIKTKKKVRMTEITRSDVDEFMLMVSDVAEKVRAMIEDDRLETPVEGGHCWYCKASGICPTKAKSQLSKDFA